MGALTVGIVTKPFAFEGKRRMDQAEKGIAELRKHVDSLVVIPNERLKLVSGQRITLANAFSIADDVLRQGVQSISDLIQIPGIVNLDFEDVKSIMQDAGYAHMGVGRAAGKDKAEQLLRLSPVRCLRPLSQAPRASSSTSSPLRTSPSTRSMSRLNSSPSAQARMQTSFGVLHSTRRWKTR